ncbi:unnamed protein product, partial [marine sediment metagenome]
ADATKEHSRRFNHFGLTLMFFGMQLKRWFLVPMQAWIKSYADLVKGQTEASRGLTRLNVHWTYFRFIVGSALAGVLLPMIPRLIELLDWATAFVEAHPEVVFIMIAGALVGITLATLGPLIAFLANLPTVTLSTSLAAFLVPGGGAGKTCRLGWQNNRNYNSYNGCCRFN